MAEVNLDRRAIINYSCVRGDTFIPPPVSFTIDEEPEDFVDCELTMQVRKGNELMLSLTNAEENGITVDTNALQYMISAEKISTLDPGIYQYDVQKKDAQDIVSTIQAGNIQILKDQTK